MGTFRELRLQRSAPPHPSQLWRDQCPLAQLCHLFTQLIDRDFQVQLRHACDTLRREWRYIHAKLTHAAVLGSELTDQQ